MPPAQGAEAGQHLPLGQAGVEPRNRFRELLGEYAGGYLHGPFNDEARLLAGFDADELLLLVEPSAG